MQASAKQNIVVIHIKCGQCENQPPESMSDEDNSAEVKISPLSECDPLNGGKVCLVEHLHGSLQECMVILFRCSRIKSVDNTFSIYRYTSQIH